VTPSRTLVQQNPIHDPRRVLLLAIPFVLAIVGAHGIA